MSTKKNTCKTFIVRILTHRPPTPERHGLDIENSTIIVSPQIDIENGVPLEQYDWVAIRFGTNSRMVSVIFDSNVDKNEVYLSPQLWFNLQFQPFPTEKLMKS